MFKDVQKPHPPVDRLQSVAFWGLFMASLVLYASPITGSLFLPFSDLPGHLGVVGAVIQRNDPAARIGEYFWLNPHFAPNCLEFYFTWFFGELFSVLFAARLFALLGVVALPLSFLYTLRAFGRSRWLVFLAFPFSYPRILWFGFMGSTLAISFMLLSVAAAWEISKRRDYRAEVVCAAALCLGGLSHPFFFLASLALVLVVVSLGAVKPSRPMKKLSPALVFLPPIALFYGWFFKMMSGNAHPKAARALKMKGDKGRLAAFWEHLVERAPPEKTYWEWLDKWSLYAYRDRALEEEVLRYFYVALGACLLAALLSRIVRGGAMALGDTWSSSRAQTPHAKTTRRDLVLYELRSWRRWLPATLAAPLVFACVAVTYFHLPGSIKFPVVWWAVAQRLVTPLFLLSILLVPRSLPRRLAPLLVIPALMGSTLYGLHLRRDFVHHFNGQEMQGLPHALATIPRGKRVMGLYDDKETHYSHFQLHFAAAYYVAVRGGFALPFPVAPGYKKIAWAYPKKVTPGPPWGKIQYFNFRRHGRYYDYFLIKSRRGGRIPWRRFPKRCTNIHGPFGLWWVVERIKRPGC